jgi:hypothetical protein
MAKQKGESFPQDDEQDDLNEFELTIPQKQMGCNNTEGGDKSDAVDSNHQLFNNEQLSNPVEIPGDDGGEDNVNAVTINTRKVWKRMPELPEQDASIKVKATKTLKQDLISNKELFLG